MRLSIAAKIFAGFTAIIILFGGVSTYSLVRMHQIQNDLRFLNRVYLRLNEAYIQLNLLITEVHTLQNNLINLLGSMPKDRNPVMVTRWIRMARNHRRKRIKQGIRIARHAKHTQFPAPESKFIDRVVSDLEKLQREFKKSDQLYNQLFKDASNADGSRLPARVQLIGSGLRRRERESFSTLRSLSNALRRRLSNNVVPKVIRAAGRLELTENRAFYATTIWAVLALVVGVAITWLSQITLRPLSRLAEGARRIGKGEYELRMEVKSADEVGALAREFNVMAGALEERENRLIETERRAARAQRMATMGHLAAQITHEIRNPLSSISLNAEMLEEEIGEGGDTDEARDLARLIQKEVDRLAEITEEYLQFARMPQLKLERDDVGAVIGSLVDFLRRRYEKDDIDLRCDIEPDLPSVMLDENQLRRAFLNILKNAREAMGKGGTIAITTFSSEAQLYKLHPKKEAHRPNGALSEGQVDGLGDRAEVRAEVRAENRAKNDGTEKESVSVVEKDESLESRPHRHEMVKAGSASENGVDETTEASPAAAGSGGTSGSGECVVVRIRDDGPGIPEAKLAEIFEPFFSTKDTGTGLGLAISQQILQEHGAMVEVTSQEGQGTQFEIVFPTAPS